MPFVWQARRVVSAKPTQEHTCSTVSKCGNWQAHPLKGTRSAVYPSVAWQAHRSRAPAQEHQAAIKSTHSAVYLFGTHAHKSTRSAEYLCVATDKHTRSRASAQHCIQVWQLVSTPAQKHPPNTVPKCSNWQAHALKAPAQQPTCVWQLVSTPAQAYLSVASGKHTCTPPCQSCIRCDHC